MPLRRAALRWLDRAGINHAARVKIMAAPLRPDEIRALESVKRGPIKRSNEGGDSEFQSLKARGMVVEKRGTFEVTTRGKTTLQRRGSVRRSTR